MDRSSGGRFEQAKEELLIDAENLNRKKSGLVAPMRKLHRTLLLFRHCHPLYYPKVILLVIALGIYEIISPIRWFSGLTRFLSSCSIVLNIAGQRFAVPLHPGDLGVIFDCFIEDMYGSDPRFVPAQGFVCLDIGAKIGAVSARWRTTNSRGTIIAVEPHPRTFARLNRNKLLNKWKNVECVHAALSASSGTVLMDVSKAHTMAIVDSAAHGGATVVSLTLDDLMRRRGIKRIDLCKIDVEGHEEEILKGAAESLPLIERLAVEFHSRSLRDAVVARMESNFEIVRETGGNVGMIFAINKGMAHHQG